MTTRRMLLLSCAAMIASLIVFAAGAQLQSFATSELTIVSATGPHRFTVEVAETPAQMEQGLMFRRSLAPDAGINSGFMMPQVTAAALASENKGLAHPASVDSITTSGNKEDYVSMGMAAAIKLKRVVANTTNVLAIEACAAAQALDFLTPLKSSPPLQKAHAAIREVSSKIEQDRVFAEDFVKLAELIRSAALAK